LIHKIIGVKFIINEFEKDDYDEEIQEDEEDEDYMNLDNDKEDDSDNDDKNIDEMASKDDVESKCFIFSCVGIGLKNVARIEM